MKFKHIKFEGFGGYINYLGYYAGYGGMAWNDMYEIQSSFIDTHNWCDTGYNNALDGSGEAITLGTGGFQSYDLGRTFSLVQGTFASAWEAKQPVYFNSYTYTYGQGFTLKASDKVKLGQDGKTVIFSNYGSDFKNISAIAFISGVGQAGNTCSYGTPTYGYILVMDDLTVKWNYNNAGMTHGQHRPMAHHHIAFHRALPHVNANFAPANVHVHGDSGNHGSTGVSHHAGGYNSQLLSLAGHDPGGLTASFTLPQPEHFGF